MSETLDRRRHAYRADLADAQLEGRVTAERFVAGTKAAIAAPSASCHVRPEPGAPVDTEMLCGEPVAVFEAADGWCWVQSLADGYVGYVRLGAVGDAIAADMLVKVPLAPVFPGPSIKLPPRQSLPMGALLTAAAAPVEGGGERFHQIAGEERYVLAKHLAPLGTPPRDWVALAERYVGAPYVWGGKTWDGIDCSGLVQLALQTSGNTAPRDSDMQAAELGEPLPADAPLVRGDLIFWKGHVGIMVDDTRLLHANGHFMMTVIEPLASTVARLDGIGLPVLIRRRVVTGG